MNFLRCLGGSLLVFGLLTACNHRPEDHTLFQEYSNESGVHFFNQITENDTLNAYRLLYIYNGSGVGVSDINNDGLKDIVFVGNMVPGKIFINTGEFVFEELAGKDSGFNPTGWVHGITVVDINDDGFDDLYLSIGGLGNKDQTRNQLYINNGDLSFTEQAQSYGLADPSLTTHSVFFDYDNDGDLDAYLMNYENNPEKDPNTIRPKNANGKSPSLDRFYENVYGKFIDRTIQAGILHEGYGLGISITDFNDDGWLDIYVSNDFVYDDLMYLNNQDGTFTETLNEFVGHTSNFGMGIDIADLNNDGFNDIVQVDMLPEDNRRQKKLLSGLNYDRQQLLLERGYTSQYMRNSLQLNSGTGKFQEIGMLAGISNTDWSWSPLIADYDNDGYKDVFITNGYVKDVTDVDFRDYIVNESRNSNMPFNPTVIASALADLKGERTPNYAYKNGGDLVFENVAETWGLAQPSFSTGSAYSDLDNDGDLDLLVNNLNDESFVFKNNSIERDSTHYLDLELSVNGNSLLAIGTQVELRSNGEVYMSEMSPFRGFQSSVDPVVHFGLGRQRRIDTLIVRWPDNSEEVVTNVTTNQRLKFNKTGVGKPKIKERNLKSNLFNEESTKYGFSYHHQESPFVDFKREALLPHKLSTDGPISTVGDVNSDGLDDFYIGSAAGGTSKLFIQTEEINGVTFRVFEFDDSKPFEDSDAVFFDADNDRDLDLYVVSGSNEFELGSTLYADRLYLNDGNGKFSLAENALPKVNNSGSKVVANDFDNDGDLDLFVAGRVTPGSYPKPGISQLLINNSGVFTNKIKELAPDLEELGMIKDAVWADIDNNGSHELIVAGEFMPISVFKWESNRFVNVTNISGLRTFSGWWNTIEVVDIDADGDMDIIGGNLGLNSRYKASQSEPLSVYANDYDANGQLDAIISYFNGGKEYVIHDRVTLTQQISAIKKKFPKNLEFAEATIHEVFSKETLSEAYIVRATHFESSIFLNDGTGVFTMSALPIESQFSPINDVLVFDYDQDGILDILLAGNSNAPEVFNGNYDAQASLLLRGKGNGKFESLPLFDSGFVEGGAITDIEKLKIDNKEFILALRNNDNASLYALSEGRKLGKGSL